MNKILYTVLAVIGLIIAFAVLDISNSKPANAGIFDSIKDAITGHVDDVKDRLKDDQFITGGDVKKSSTFTWSSDSIHYADGGVQIINKDGKKYVQLTETFSAGLAPDLYIYLAPGHIDSDAEFVNGNKLELGKLVKGSGASFYEIPSYLNSYSTEKFSVVIHCKRFNEPMGAAHFN